MTDFWSFVRRCDLGAAAVGLLALALFVTSTGPQQNVAAPVLFAAVIGLLIAELRDREASTRGPRFELRGRRVRIDFACGILFGLILLGVSPTVHGSTPGQTLTAVAGWVAAGLCLWLGMRTSRAAVDPYALPGAAQDPSERILEGLDPELAERLRARLAIAPAEAEVAVPAREQHRPLAWDVAGSVAPPGWRS